MQPAIETVSGSPYEMGRQQGQIFRHIIRANLQQWAMRHDFQGSDDYLDERLAARRSANQTLAPWIEEEMRGIADGSGVDLPGLHRLNLRAWEVPHLPQAPAAGAPADSGGCTAIGMIAGTDGVAIGGNLDCQRAFYVLLRRIPKEGLAHVTLAFAGGIWNQNGMNEAGLFMGSNGMGAHADFKDPDPAPRPPAGTINRLVLQTCRNVAEAVATIRQSRTSHSFVLGDAAGSLAVVQVMGSLFDVQYARDSDNMVFATNHACLPGLVNPLRAQHCEPYVAEKSRVRFDVLAAARREKPRTFDTLRALLRSHDGYPNSICNDLSAMSLLARPQRNRNEALFADMPPCHNDYHAVPVKP
jgi:hypothetical protein